MDATARHLRLLTETIAAVNSTLDLEEVLALVASKVAEALEADACFVYLYDERADELVLRATHGTRVEEMTRRPRMRPGEGITGTAAAERAPIAIAAARAPRSALQALPEPARGRVRVDSRGADPGAARSWRGRSTSARARRASTREAEIDLLVAIASQVAQSIEHARLYADAQRRVHELEALAQISEAVSESLYLEESLEAIVKTTIDAPSARPAPRSCSRTARSPGRRAAPAPTTSALPLRWKRRQIGELVCDRDTPFSDEDRALLEAIAHHAAVALEHGRAVMRGVLAQEIHHRVKNNLQTVASLLRLQARAPEVDPRRALTDSVNRILAIAAVHEVLTEHREDDVDLAELIERLRAMLVQGLVAGQGGRGGARAGLARRRPRDGARARLQRAASRTRSSTAAARSGSSSRGAAATSCSRSPTTAPGSNGERRRHGALDRARARARRAAAARSCSTSEPGLRAEVLFPA